MTVMLSVGISVVNRSTQDLKVTRQEEEGSQVFNGAEAGIESALANVADCIDTVCNGSLDLAATGNATIPVGVDYTIEPVHEFEGVVTENTAIKIDTSTVPGGGGTLAVEWGLNQTCADNVAAVEVIIYNTTNSTARREGYSPACGRGDNFVLSLDNSLTGNYFNLVNVSLNNGDTLVRLKPLYNDAAIKVTGSWTLPIEYYKVRSTGTSGVGNETKVIEVTRSLPTLPSVFDYVLYSGGTLIK